MEQLWIIRHGESIANIAAARAEAEGREVIDVAMRDADVPLSDTGRDQSRALGELLRQLQPAPEVAWVSPYRRAQETFALAGAPVEAVGSDERLRDRELGVLDLLTRAGVAARHPEEAARRLHLGKYYHRPPGGESWADVSLRLRSFLGDALTRPERSGIIVAHEAVVLLLVGLLTGIGERELMAFASENPVLNASVTSVVREGGSWRLDEFSAVDHLRREGAAVTAHQGSRDDAH